MKAVVLSHRHALLPYAHRLAREGTQVDTFVWAHEFGRAWDGQIAKGRLTRETAASLATQAAGGSLAVLCDVPGLEGFTAGPHVYGRLPIEREPTSALRLGGWFDGESWSLPHLLVVDRGAWQGGLGPLVDAALTMVRVDSPTGRDLFADLTAPVREQLKAREFKGLVQVGLDEQAGGGVAIEGMVAGWPALHSQAFVAELETLSGLVGGGGATLASKYVTVLALSVAPWPSPGEAPQGLPVGGLTPIQQGRVFWHAVEVDAGARQLRTAGLDGFVGVARGAAETLALAQGRALEVALRVVLPGKQFRPDAGGLAAVELARLEDQYGLVL